MRLALALAFASGCLPQASDPPPPPDQGWTGSDGSPISGCTYDAECGSEVCARDGYCYAASSVRFAHTAWTVHGATANGTTCANRPQLHISFHAPSGQGFGFAPVPCSNGEYTIDKLPKGYTTVELGTEGASYGTTASIDRTTGEATIDLP